MTATTPTTATRRVDRLSVAVLGVLLVVGGVVHAIGMDQAPQRIDDEGTYVAQAWAVENLGSLTHYTYWYDHPPVGWLQLAGYTAATDAFDRASSGVLAGREFMLVLQLVSMALLWVLARRLALSRPAAALAVGAFSLSPLAVQFHRTVFLDNIATPWLLGAFVLALTPRRALAAYAASGACFAVAVLTKETSLLALPVLAWLLWREAPAEVRRYAISLAGSLFGLLAGGYVLFAAVKGELLPQPGRTSLLEGVQFQLGGRPGSGSVFDAGSVAHDTVSRWLALDPVLPVLSLIAALVAFVALPRLRPFAAGFLVLVAVALRPGGYLPVPYVIALLPLGALLVAGAAQAAFAGAIARAGTGRARAPRLAGAGLATALAAFGVAPVWADELHTLAVARHDEPMADTVAWLVDNVSPGDRLVVDDALWVDLAEAGLPRSDVVWYFKVDTDPEVQARAPGGWRDYDWLVSTQSFRSQPENVGPQASAALDHSVLIAQYGEGEDRVEIRRVVEDTDGIEGDVADQRAEALAGRQLLANPSFDATDEAARALIAGEVDQRLLAVLAAAVRVVPLRVDGFVQDPGEAAAGWPVREVDLAVDPSPGRTLQAFLRRQVPPFTPDRVEWADGRLTVTFAPLSTTTRRSP